MAELSEFCGFQYYGGKHLENDLTRFIQQFWLHNKFGVDKRTSHLSSMIVSGQITREDAIKEYSHPLYETEDMERVIDRILFSLEMTSSEFNEIKHNPTKQSNLIYSFSSAFAFR